MVELFIDNQRVALPASLSLKLTDENPLLTDSGKYTLDLELPLQGCLQNLRVFGALSRIDVSKGMRTWAARLMVDNHCMLSGIATATAYSQDSIKIQLVGGNSEFNFLSKFDQLYIDDLYIDFSDDIDCLFLNLTEANSMTEAERQRKLYGAYGKTDFVYLPVYNAAEGKTYNDISWYMVSPAVFAIFLPHSSYDKVAENKLNGTIKNVVPKNISHQPYFCYLLRKIFEALGYKVSTNDIENSPLRNIYVVTSRGGTQLGSNSEEDTVTTHYGRTSFRRRTKREKVGYLPHWTLQEFLMQVSLFFGVAFYFNDRKGEVSIRFRASEVGAQETQIAEIIDEYTASCDSDESTGKQSDNLHFDLSDADPYQQISQDILDAVKVVEVSELPSVANSSVIYQVGGKQYIYYVSDDYTGYIRVNRLRDLIRNEDAGAEAVSLGIVPVRMVCGQIKAERADSSFSYPAAPREVDVPMAQVNEEVSSTTGASVFELIDGSASVEKAAKKDCIEVALNDGVPQLVEQGLPRMPYPFTTTQDARSPWASDIDRGFSLEMNQVDGETTLYKYVATQLVSCNRQVEYTVKFIYDGQPDPTGLFIIRGKKFFCKKLEYEITHSGISRLKTGVFYEATD